MLDEISVKIAKAADILVERGGCKHTFVDPKGGICMYAALALANDCPPRPMLEAPPEMKPIIDRVTKAMDFGWSDYGVICSYNNTHEFEERVAKLREIANDPKFAVPEPVKELEMV